MQTLSNRQQALLAALPRQQRVARVAGIVMSVVGILYIAWAITRFDPAGDPTEGIGFDAVVTAPVATLFVKYRDYLNKRVWEDSQAHALAGSLKRNMNFSAGLLLLAFRVILGLIVMLLGFATMTVVIERARLLRILEARGVSPEPLGAGAAAGPGLSSTLRPPSG